MFVKTSVVRRPWMLCVVLALACAIICQPGKAFGAGGGTGLGYVPGALLIQLTGQATMDDAVAVATKANAQVVRALPMPGWYQLQSNQADSNTTIDMQTTLSGDPRVAQMCVDAYRKLAAIPNDTYWNLQWGMRMINMPAAWDITKGSPNVRVAVVDTGVRLDHPDLQGRLLPGYDVADNDPDPNPPTTPSSWATHGTHVAGIIAAQGDNGIGVVGVCWNGVQVIPIKVVQNSSTDGFFPVSTGIVGLNEAETLGAQVINMSFGGPVAIAAEETEMKQLAAAGIILVASAGNDAGPVGYPAAYPEVIAVSAVNNQGNLASYSNFGPQIAIGAPGGDNNGDGTTLDPAQIISTAYYPIPPSITPSDTYLALSGTSMACPHVVGAAALLLSEGVAPANVLAALEGSATPAGGAIPNQQFGYGILNVAGALTYSPVTLSIDRPRQGDTLATMQPFFRLSVSGASAGSISVTIDGAAAITAGVPVDSRVQSFSFDATSGQLVFSWLFTSTGSHTIVATAVSASDATKSVTKSVTFNLQGVRLAPGRYMVSIPYPASSPDPFSILGSQYYRLARWRLSNLISGTPVYEYALYNFPGLKDDPNASLQPPDVNAGEAGGSPFMLPRGIGYWLDVRSAMTVFGSGFVDDRLSYYMDLPTGWNQIGDPYPFPIPWGTVLVSYMGQTLPIAQAAAQGWISPTVYRYQNGAYVSDTAPNGTLQPWAGYWVKVRVPFSGVTLTSTTDPRGIVTMTFVPLQSGNAVLPFFAQPPPVTQSVSPVVPSVSASGGSSDATRSTLPATATRSVTGTDKRRMN